MRFLNILLVAVVFLSGVFFLKPSPTSPPKKAQKESLEKTKDTVHNLSLKPSLISITKPFQKAYRPKNSPSEKSDFSKTYEKIAEVALKKNQEKYKVTLKDTVQASSLIIVGKGGETLLKSLELGKLITYSNKKDVFFKNDWESFSLPQKPFKSFTLNADSKSTTSSLHIYAQVLTGE